MVIFILDYGSFMMVTDMWYSVKECIFFHYDAKMIQLPPLKLVVDYSMNQQVNVIAPAGKVEAQPIPTPTLTPTPTKNNSALVPILIGIIVVLSVALIFALTGRIGKGAEVVYVTPTPTAIALPSDTPETTSGIDDTTIPTGSGTPITSTTATTSTTPTPTASEASLSVYMFDNAKFSKPSGTDYTTAVIRKTFRKDVATFSVEQIIIGPTQIEVTAKNLRPTFGEGAFVKFSSTSNCSGKDFSITVTEGDATVKFCRTTVLSGDSSGNIVSQQITNTLKQFSSVKQVRVLNKAGNCFDDLSGLGSDQCWQ